MEKLPNIAELEAGVIYVQTKKGLAAAKTHGLARGPAARRAKCAAHAASLRPILVRMEAEGRRSLNAIARALTAEGVPTAAGATNWTPTGVARVKAKLAA
jgi:hypothetical protein